MAMRSHRRNRMPDDPKSILVVEDSPALRNLYAEILDGEGFLVETARNGREAIRRVRGQPPALVVLDYRLPDLTASTILQSLRDICGQDLPVVLVSADDQLAAKARQIDVACYLPKPFPIADLVNAVHQELTCVRSSEKGGTMYRKILVPLDGSDLSESVLDQIPHLAGPSTEVVLLQVLDPFPTAAMIPVPAQTAGGDALAMVPPVTANPVDPEAAEKVVQDAMDYLGSKALSLKGAVGMTRTLVIEDPDPARLIVAQAKDEGAELIAMATHDHSGVSRLLLGSTAEKVLHSTSIPVLLVHPEAPAA